MEIHHRLEAFGHRRFPVVTTGTFDGVHLGHRKIIARMCEIAAEHSGETVLVSFHPHPRLVLNPESDIRLLTTIEEKTALLASLGIDHFVVLPFTAEFSRLTSLQFVRDILVSKLGVRQLVVGYDHQFGRNREGSFSELEEYGETYGFGVEHIDPLVYDGENVSSTKIRNALLEGRLEKALKFLGHAYVLSGKVVKGKGLGRKIGFPTANIVPGNHHKLIPACGVYAVKVDVEGRRFDGMLNIGHKPTVANGDRVHIEVHLLYFHGDLYGKTITVDFRKRLRDEMDFGSIENLKQQLYIDRKQTREVLKNAD